MRPYKKILWFFPLGFGQSPDSNSTLQNQDHSQSDFKLPTRTFDFGLAVALHNARKKEYGEQSAATSELNDIWETADRQYMRTLKIARIAFQNHPKADKAVMLFGRRKESLSEWLEQAQAFYANILNDSELMNALTQYGYTTEKLRPAAIPVFGRP